MTDNKALEIAIRIYNTCKKHDDRCAECPFTVNGSCMVSDGNSIPSDWNVKSLISKARN